jgi:CRISPR-associated protein Cas1
VIKRTIEISREPAHLAVRQEQLLILRKRESDRSPLPAHPPNLAGSIPCEDLGVVMVDSRETTYSHHALARLAEHGAAVVICGQDHHPVAMCLPISTNTELLARLDAQIGASKPTLKRLWQQIVIAKVAAQAVALSPCGGEAVQQARRKILSLARRVRSGDPDNVEAQAAAIYWPALFDGCDSVATPFRRAAGDRLARNPNSLLDYGYSALRAAIARAIVAAGLLPALGIKHVGRSNPYCLADDLMEPLRPLVDRRVRWLAQRGELELCQPVKAELLGVLTEEIGPHKSKGPLLVAVTRYVSSFVRVLTGEEETITIPAAGDGGDERA